MIKTALVIVPHPDDEINLAGGLFPFMHENDIQCTVVFCTNGDSDPLYAKKRYLEVLKAKAVLRYDDVVFLGYGDGLNISHIYDLPDNDIAVSTCGKIETYSTGNTPEYCFQKEHIHRKYTRSNLKNDIKSVVLDKLADLIICVDNDCHYDHRCVSLLFDEAIGEILKCNHNYRPLILKGFAYMGTWAGIDDFFTTWIQPVHPTVDGKSYDEACVYPYLWSERVRIQNHKCSTTMKLWKNTFLNSILAHLSQSRYASANDNAFTKFSRIANPESCYWYRRVDNLCLNATISVTSGELGSLNDFKLADTISIGYENFYDKEIGWKPDENDLRKEVIINFGVKRKLKLIKIYQGVRTRIEEIDISTIEGETIHYINPTPDISVVKIILNLQTVELKLKFHSTDRICIHEIECFDSLDKKEWLFSPFIQYVDRRERNPIIITKVFGYLYHIISYYLILIKKIPIKIKLILKK